MKTIKNIITLSLVAAAAILTVPSCQKTGNDVEYLQTSIDRYTFMGTGDQTLHIGIQSTASWTTECDEDWIILEQTADTLTVSVKENKSGFQKSGNILVKSGNLTEEIAIEQLSDRFKGRFDDMYYLNYNVAMSRNGNYICGMQTKEVRNDAYIYTPVVINTKTGEKTYLTDIQGYDAVQAISDDGAKIVYRDLSGASSICKVNDVEIETKLPEGYRNPFISNMSADGSIMVGFCKKINNTGFSPYVPVKWTNDEPEILEYPNHTIWGEDYLMETMARGCSDDGSVIFGSEWTNFGLIYWKNGKMSFPGYDYADKANNSSVILEAEITNISPNGKYIGTSNAEFVEMSYPIKKPAVMNTETNQLILLVNAYEGSCTHVTNDGLAFTAYPSVSSRYGNVTDLNTGDTFSVPEWLLNNYNISVSDRYVRQVSNDGKVIMGIQTMSTPIGDAYIPWYCYVGE